MSQNFGLDPALSAAITDTAVRIVDQILQMGGGLLSEGFRRSKVILRDGLSNYIQYSLRRHSFVKTILHPNSEVPLDDVYVSLRLLSPNDEEILDVKLVEALDQDKHICVIGTAGSGKSMVLRRLNNTLALTRSDTIPIFFSLRALNNLNDNDITEAVYEEIHKFMQALELKEFKKLLSGGKITLILDGFDEVDHDIRSNLIKQIDVLLASLPDARIVISSRPDESLNYLQSLKVFEILPLSLGQAKALIAKLDYDESVKDRFTESLENGLFEAQEDLLSVPLLISIKLLTFSQHAEVSEKIYIFYKQAYEVLFERHDRSKGAYQRKFRSGLDVAALHRIFSHFAAATYFDYKISFSATEALEYLDSAVKYEQSEVDENTLLLDLIEAVCLLQRDGTELTFVHRSFQEYFTGAFVASLEPPYFQEGVDAATARVSDGVVRMIHDISEAKFEQYWLVAAANNLDENFQRLKIENFPKAISLFHQTISLMIHEGDIVTAASLDLTPEHRYLRVIGELYPAYLPSIYHWPTGNDWRRVFDRNPGFLRYVEINGIRNGMSEFDALIDRSIDKIMLPIDENGSFPNVDMTVELVGTDLLLALGYDQHLSATLDGLSRLINDIDAKYRRRNQSLKSVLSKDRLKNAT